MGVVTLHCVPGGVLGRVGKALKGGGGVVMGEGGK